VTRPVDLRHRSSSIQIVTGDKSNGALTTLGVFGLIGAAGAGGGALIMKAQADGADPGEEVGGPSPKTLATAAAISGGAGLLFLLLGQIATTPYIDVRGPVGGGRVAAAPRVQPIVAATPGASGDRRLYVGMGLSF
jgi:hypothetical protein